MKPRKVWGEQNLSDVLAKFVKAEVLLRCLHRLNMVTTRDDVVLAAIHRCFMLNSPTPFAKSEVHNTSEKICLFTTRRNASPNDSHFMHWCEMSCRCNFSPRNMSPRTATPPSRDTTEGFGEHFETGHPRGAPRPQSPPVWSW